jgi:hypothetical protein
VELGHFRRYFSLLLDAQLRAAGFLPVRLHHIFSWLVPPVYVVRRTRPRSVEDQLGLDTGGPVVAALATWLSSAERKISTSLPIRLGTSVIAVARKVDIRTD